MSKKFTLIYNIIIAIDDIEYIVKTLDENEIFIHTRNDEIITISLGSKEQKEQIFFEIFTELKNY